MVHAAAGGTGCLILQACRAAGATVIATSSSPEKQALVAAAGAHHSISYADFPLAVKQITGACGVPNNHNTVSVHLRAAPPTAASFHPCDIRWCRRALRVRRRGPRHVRALPRLLEEARHVRLVRRSLRPGVFPSQRLPLTSSLCLISLQPLPIAPSRLTQGSLFLTRPSLCVLFLTRCSLFVWLAVCLPQPLTRPYASSLQSRARVMHRKCAASSYHQVRLDRRGGSMQPCCARCRAV